MLLLNFVAQAKLQNSQMLGLILAALFFGVLLIFFFVFARYFGLWIQCKLTRADIGLWSLLG